MPNVGKQACDAHKQANKQVIKQKRVSLKDKCRFGSNVQSSIGLEYGQHRLMHEHVGKCAKKKRRSKERQTVTPNQFLGGMDAAT